MLRTKKLEGEMFTITLQKTILLQKRNYNRDTQISKTFFCFYISNFFFEIDKNNMRMV